MAAAAAPPATPGTTAAAPTANAPIAASLAWAPYASSSRRLPRRCLRAARRRYYLLNNYNPGYFGDGSNAYTDTNPNNTVYTIPPSSQRSIGNLMNAHHVSWAYYGDQWNLYLQDQYEQSKTDEYCNICNWAQYETSIMTNPEQRAAHLRDTTDLYTAIANGTLPAVSYVKPSGLVRRPSGLLEA